MPDAPAAVVEVWLVATVTVFTASLLIKPLVVNAVEDDTEFARQNIRNMIQKGNDAMENLIHIAKETEHPRAYEVVAGLLKTLADANKDLLELQKRKKDLEPKITNNTVNVDKAVFVGSTNDLVKLLKGNK